MTRQKVKVGDTGLLRQYDRWVECAVVEILSSRKTWRYLRTGPVEVAVPRVRMRTIGGSDLYYDTDIDRRDLLVGEEADAKRRELEEVAIRMGERRRQIEVERWKHAEFHVHHILKPTSVTPEQTDAAVEYLLANFAETYEGRRNREKEERER